MVLNVQANITKTLSQANVNILETEDIQLETLGKADADFLETEGMQLDLFKEQTDKEEDKEFDSKKIHQFFQQQKKQVLKTLSTSVTEIFVQKASWFVNGCYFQEDEVTVSSFNSQFYPNYFAVIAPDLGLEPVLAEQFNQALQKGLAKRSTTQNGIKVLSGSLIELKINHALRLYTTKIYKNVDGQYLVIFDTLGNHQDIKKQLRRDEGLTIVAVERMPQSKKSLSSAHELSLSVSASINSGFLSVAKLAVNSTSANETDLASQIP